TDTSTPYIYTLSLHDALPICALQLPQENGYGDIQVEIAHHHTADQTNDVCVKGEQRKCDHEAQYPRQNENLSNVQAHGFHGIDRSEEHTSELQSLRHLVCRLL